MQRYLTIFAAVLCLHCGEEEADVIFDSPETQVQCQDDDDNDIAAPSVELRRLQASSDGKSLLVFGTVAPSKSLAIRSLTIAGVAVTSESFNYSSWNATLPESAFAIQDGSIALLVRGSDACQPFEQTLSGAAPDDLMPKLDPSPVGGSAAE